MDPNWIYIRPYFPSASYDDLVLVLIFQTWTSPRGEVHPECNCAVCSLRFVQTDESEMFLSTTWKCVPWNTNLSARWNTPQKCLLRHNNLPTPQKTPHTGIWLVLKSPFVAAKDWSPPQKLKKCQRGKICLLIIIICSRDIVIMSKRSRISLINYLIKIFYIGVSILS